MANRPAYSSLTIRPTAIRAAAIRVVVAERRELFGTTAVAWTTKVDDDGNPVGHRHGPMTIDEARQLAARQAAFYSIPLEATP